GYELSKRTLGLVGMGEIAHRVAKRAKAFGMNVIGYDPFVAPFDHVIQETGIKQVEMDELLKESDFVSVHVPLNKATELSIRRDNFPLMKPRAYVLNSGRGGIIHEEDPVRAVEDKQIARPYLDVLEKEPVQKDSPLTRVESIKLSPHIAGL